MENVAKKMTLSFIKIKENKHHTKILDCDVCIENHKADGIWMNTVQFLHDCGFKQISDTLKKEEYIKNTLDFHPILIDKKMDVAFDENLKLINTVFI